MVGLRYLSFLLRRSGVDVQYYVTRVRDPTYTKSYILGRLPALVYK